MALIREVAARKRGEKHYLVQVAGALAMVDGCVAEMATGEGKTLTATLTATIAGWRGRGCHVITVNDYLAKRDAEWMAGIYEFCGLTVAYVQGETKPPERRAAYHADITYCTNKEVCADFLRDRLALGRLKELLLDEPSAGMTHDETAELMNDILLVRERNKDLSIIIVEHEMGVIERITNRCVVLNFGRKIAEGPYRDVAADAQVQAAYLGVA